MPQEQVRVKDAQDADTLVFRYTANGVHLSTAAGVDVTSKVVGAGLHVLERLVKTTFQVLEIHERMDYGDLDVARYKLEHGMEALAGPDSPSVSSSTASPITAAPAASSPSSKSSATPAPAAGSSAHSHSASSASPASRLAPASSSASSSAPSRLASSSAPSRLATSSAPSRLATSSAPSRLATSSASSRSASSAALAPAAASTSALAPAAASTSSASSRLASSAALAPAAASTSALAPAAASTSSVSSSSASSTLRGKERQLAFVPHPPWTQSELDALKAGREATPQKSWAELADITGHTAVACDNTWRRKFGKASSSASTSAPKRSRWTGEDDAKLDRLRARGLSDSAIAAQLGRTVSAVKQRSAGRVNNAALALAAPQPAPRQPAPAPSASTSTSAGPSASAIGQALRNLEKRSYYQHASTPNRVALEEAARASGAGVPRLMGKITTYNVYTTTTRRSSTRPSLYFNAPGLSSWHQTESYPVSLTVLRANAPHILTPGLHQVSVEAAQPYELQYHCADGARSTVGKLADLLSSAQYSTARQWIDNVQAEKDGRAPTTASLQANQAVQDARLARLARRNRAHEEGEDDAALNGDGMGGDDDA
ncbi:hypothetical protein Rhopal_004413-T1 [Rhodotorula paludigena]|uniref:Myb-like domain-containing protein n=1 Tax=Rhodotorula paludigena TaxID=86838 RepID=A0AAV5GPU7_9BASI|nr:hypothetical protein Rhopal_004413-T1 [Rhodotorula paludigena]